MLVRRGPDVVGCVGLEAIMMNKTRRLSKPKRTLKIHGTEHVYVCDTLSLTHVKLGCV